MRLSDWGRQYGLEPRTSWQMMKDGRLPDGVEVERVGHRWYVIIPDTQRPKDRTVLYAHVSSSDQSADLVQQSERLQKFAQKQGWTVDEVVLETGSGLNGQHPKLLRHMRSEGSLRLVVEHQDRLARFGFEMVDAALKGRNGEVVVVENRETDDDLVRDMVEVMTPMCAQIHGKRSARRRAEKAVAAAVGPETEETVS